VRSDGPALWASLCPELVAGAAAGPGHAEAACLVLRTLAEDVTVYNEDMDGGRMRALLSALLPAAAAAAGEPGMSAPLVLNNMAWLGGMSLLDFLRDVGKHARVGVMLSKDSVKARMGTPGAEGEAGEGMSYTEFTYQLLQAWVPARSAACAPAEPAAPADAPPRPPLVAFATATTFHICSRSTAYRSRHAGSARGRGSARLTWRPAPQIGGSDQWGNITAGTDLIRRVQQREGAIGAAAAPGLHACVPGLMGTS
jgi:hypothetical protein